MVFLLILYTAITIILSIAVFLYWKFVHFEKLLYDTFRSQGVSGEPFIPFLGQLPEINRYRANDLYMTYYQELSEKHGNVFLVSLGPMARLVVLEPDLIGDVVGKSNAHNYMKTPLNSNVFKPLIGSHNLLVSEGTEHERARKMLNPAFHFVNLQSMISIMVNETAKAIDALLASTADKSVNMQTELSALTLAIIASCAFGKGFETIDNAKEIVGQTFTTVLEAVEYRTMRMVNQVPILAQLPLWRKHIVDRGVQEMVQFVNQIISDRKSGRSKSLCSGSDLLDLLLSAVDSNGQPFTDDEIRDESLTFVLAGHETTGNLIVWAIYALMMNETALSACLEEIDRVIPNDTDLTMNNINNLVVCEAILQETLRLYPPAPFFARQCIREHTIGSEKHLQLRVPVGAIIMINTYLLHRRADFWSLPLEFDYKRWMRDPVTGLKPKLAHPFCYLPFAAGPRNCIGQNFALLESKIILSMLLKRCTFKLVVGQKIAPDVRITMRPKYGLWATVNKRM